MCRPVLCTTSGFDSVYICLEKSAATCEWKDKTGEMVICMVYKYLMVFAHIRLSITGNVI